MVEKGLVTYRKLFERNEKAKKSEITMSFHKVTSSVPASHLPRHLLHLFLCVPGTARPTALPPQPTQCEDSEDEP